MNKIERFHEQKESNLIKKTVNYIVSYTKDATKTDVDISVGSNNLDDLIQRIKSILSETEFDSIFKIEIGYMPFG